MRIALSKYKLLQKELGELQEELENTKKKLAEYDRIMEEQNKTLDDTFHQLVDSEEIFRQLAENTNEIFWLRDNTEFIYINNQFEQIWGRDKEQVLKSPEILKEWIHPADRENVDLFFSFDDSFSGEPLVEQYRIQKPNKEIRWLWTRSFLVENDEGKPYRIVSITTDITEQKKFEESLQTAKQKAQESDLLKTTFLANISHEIRTPMNGIVGFAELLNRDDIDAETRRSYLEIMKKSSNQLICIIDDIIDFAKIESNQIRLNESQVEINKLLNQLKLIYENELIKKELPGVTIQVEEGGDSDLRIITDENRLRQIFSYLLDNSVKYTCDGFIKFGYIVAGSKIEFLVQDSGVGIPEDKHEIIFERFRQVDEGHSRRYGGVGLGLPISKGLINLLGGTIWLESEPGKGSSFHFTVPYKQRDDGSEKAGKENEGQTYLWDNKILLIVEDDDLNYEYINALLEPTKAEIVRAVDGNEAVKLCSNMNFDLILMDIQLPVLNGLQATQRIREMGKDTPIIAQTAFAMDEDEQKCFEAGCDKYITKPISKEKLYATIEALL